MNEACKAFINSFMVIKRKIPHLRMFKKRIWNFPSPEFLYQYASDK